MATDVLFPTSAELQEIARDKLPRLLAARPWSTFFPIENIDAEVLMWEQQDNYTGLQQVRGINGEPPKVQKTGARRFMETPGVYGEHIPIDELELTRRRQWGSFGTPINLSDLVMNQQDHLLQRRLDRVELTVWTLLSTGTFSVPAPTGAVAHTGTYLEQTFSAAVPWSTWATATPLADLRAIALLARGHSVDLGAGATAYMNRKTANNMLSNLNAADIYGRRTAGLGTFNSLPQMNQLFMSDGLPTVEIYDEGYLLEGSVNEQATNFTAYGTFAPYIADNKVVVIGKRPGNTPIGKYMMTRNASNPGFAPGPYMNVWDSADHGQSMPRSIKVLDGHNGGPVLTFPSAIVVMSV